MFTDPPLAHVDLHEQEARRQGVAVRLAKLPISAVLRARTVSETHGFMNALVAADSDRILGLTMIGPEAGEVVAVVQTAIIAHPTMAEGLGGLFAKVPGR
jgi:pyruvate/2-oxoglutarate dehydrogenase complex dihydrolipoamide dehydrogenase (E3) component